mmetsp:Transcript_13004/g.52385  ORF Transcript_13004/g.52385 Transcript_13004/m.52385 type:complete len:310 (-) Transcript_13004:1002-1931(-)
MECVSSLHSRRRPFSRVRRLLRPRFAPAVGHQRERHGGQAVQHVRFAPRFTRLLARARSGHMSEPLDVAPVRGRHRSVGRERVERPRLFLRVRLDRGGHLDAVRDRDIPPLLLHGRGRGSELALRFRFRRRGLLLGRMRRLLLLLFGAGLGVPLGVGRRLALPVALGTLTASSHARRLRLGRRLLRRLFRRVHVRAGRHLARDGAVVSRGRLQGPRAVRARAVLLVHILHLGPPARRRRRRRRARAQVERARRRARHASLQRAVLLQVSSSRRGHLDDAVPPLGPRRVQRPLQRLGGARVRVRDPVRVA